MAGEDEDGPSGAENDGELAKKLGRLTEEQRERYDRQVQNPDRTVSRDYRLRLATTLLKNLPAHEEGREIGELNRQQAQIAWREEHDRRTQTKSPGQETRTQDAAPPSSTPQPKPANTLDGKTPNAPPRDYSVLERSHEEAGLHLRQAQTGGSDPVQRDAQTAVLSKEQLVTMIEHFPDIRREADLKTSPSEIRERADLARSQDAERMKFDQTHGDAANRTQQQHKERDLLDYQHLAQQAGVQSKWIARQLEARGSPDAAAYKTDAFSAMHTARAIQNQRQNQHAGASRSREIGRAAQNDQPQHLAAAQDAARTGRELTSDQRANLPADARSSIESKERAASARDGTGAKADKHQQSPVRPGPGNSKGGGRSR